ncbi:aspartate/glutamate racemase family protein [Streptomyces jumonjinensis]|uniref:Arylsulfatase n=1 Tax=Streptomyces jumonjinensis TaxID=1945 RepID=A0A646KT93_STRJU|nr:aspartate/glutamate racemase family protein [Streptomyces jumonjinensis]MQT05532.1 arylsulfatase [Streptomyces jumonjinensis]
MIALLHTSPVHVPVFDALRDEDHPGVDLRHLVHEDLLERAVAHGPGAVAQEVAEVIAGAVAGGARAVLCTCSTLGAVAEEGAGGLGVPVLRVDRPMAAEAARTGRRIVVIAALHSTLEPTAALIRAEADAPELRTVLVEGAWERFQAGDREGYLDAVAAAVDTVRDADVIVLAQASMADAAERAATDVPVLSSPRPGLRAAVTAGSR